MRGATGYALVVLLLSCSLLVADAIQGHFDTAKDIALLKKLKKCDSKVDVIFLIDSSHSVGEKNFRKQLKAIAQLITFMEQGHKKDQFRFGAVTFSTKADMVMSLKDFAGQPDAAARYIRSAVEYRPGQSGIGEALRLVDMVGFDGDSGHRKDAEKALVLFADTQGNTELHPARVAYHLRHKSVVLMAVGIGHEISEKYLESITKAKGHVLMAQSFDQLPQINTAIMGMVCHHFHKKAAPKKHGPCPAGQKLQGSKCVIVGPSCKKKCPKNYILVYPCQCIVEEGKCPNQCPKGKINNKKCECVLKNPPKCHLKKCPPHYTLNKAACKCECKKVCNKNLLTLNPNTCTCECNSKCRENYILNTKKCLCQKIHCGKGYILYHGKCRNDIHKVCPNGEILFRDICLKQKECPNGFVNHLGICKPKCEHGMDDDGNCMNACKKGEYLLNGKCQQVTPLQCNGPSHFAVPAPLCPRTCEEPIALTRCKKKGEPSPGCVCDPGFFLYKGRCVHASSCPNKPICLKEVDILFMMDSSLDVGENRFFLQKSLVRSIVQEFDTKDGMKQRVSVLSFNEKVDQSIGFNDYKKTSHEQMLERIMDMKFKAGNSYLGEALHYARSHAFTRERGMREDVPRIIMLLTRGEASAGPLDATWEARKIREAGITLIIIGIGENIESKTDTLFKIAGTGDKVFVFALRKLRQIHEIVSRVVATHCDQFVCPRPRVIHHRCRDEYQQLDRVEFYADGFKCQKNVVKNWKRVRCDCPKPRTVRTSCTGMYRHIIKYHYKLDKEKLVCHELSQRMKIRCRCPQVHKEISGCSDMIRRTKFTFYKLLPGGPEGFKCEPQFAWRSNRCDCPKREVTHGPCKNHFRLRKTTFYNLVQGHCVTAIKTTEIQCACPKPRIHTSACDGKNVAVKVKVETLSNDNRCATQLFVGYKPCKQSCKHSMDVGILVDTSKSEDYTTFPAVRNFVASLVQKLPISRAGTHVALGRFSSAETIGLLFDFFTFFSAKQAVDRINEMRYHPGSSSTAEALKMMRLTAFSSSHGSRPQVSRVLYVISDSEANGDADVESEARKLRGMGVQIIMIGIGKHIRPTYMQKIASKPHAINVFMVHNANNLVTIQDQVLESRCDAPGTINHFSVMKDIQARLRGIIAQGTNDYTALGLSELDVSQLAMIVFKINSYYSVVAGTQEWQQTKFADHIKEAIAAAAGIKVYQVVAFKIDGGAAESKVITVRFKITRDIGAKLIKKYPTLKLFSINKKPLPLDPKVIYISPYAMNGCKSVREMMAVLKDISEEMMELLKQNPPADREKMEAGIHKLNMEIAKVNKLSLTEQTAAVGLCMSTANKAVELAKLAIVAAKKHAMESLKRKDITTWEIHLVNRHLRNMHELTVHLAGLAKNANFLLKTAALDDVNKGKALPPLPSKTTATPVTGGVQGTAKAGSTLAAAAKGTTPATATKVAVTTKKA